MLPFLLPLTKRKMRNHALVILAFGLALHVSEAGRISRSSVPGPVETSVRMAFNDNQPERWLRNVSWEHDYREGIYRAHCQVPNHGKVILELNKSGRILRELKPISAYSLPYKIRQYFKDSLDGVHKIKEAYKVSEGRKEYYEILYKASGKEKIYRLDDRVRWVD